MLRSFTVWVKNSWNSYLLIRTFHAKQLYLKWSKSFKTFLRCKVWTAKTLIQNIYEIELFFFLILCRNYVQCVSYKSDWMVVFLWMYFIKKKKTHCEVIVIISGQFNSISLTSHSAEVEILLSPCQRFTIMRISDKSKPLSLVNHSAKTIHHKKQKDCMNKLTQVLSEILIVKII